MKCEVFECGVHSADEGNLQPCSACNRKYCSFHLKWVSGEQLCEDCRRCAQCGGEAVGACAECGDLQCESHMLATYDQDDYRSTAVRSICAPCEAKIFNRTVRRHANVWGAAKERKVA